MTDQVQSHRPYTDEDVRVVTRAIMAGPTVLAHEVAAAVLDALAAAGRLLPGGGRKKTQHEIDWAHRSRPEDHPTMTYDDLTEEQIDHEIAQAARLGYEPREVRRRVITVWPGGAIFPTEWETR